MAGPRKYANLPDLDAAPDIYETPELTDDASTVHDTTAQSPSLSSRNEDHEIEEGLDSGIIRSKLTTHNARDRFAGSKIDARSVDFSTRAAKAQRYYKTTSRRRRRRNSDYNGTSSSDSDDEDIETRMVRLRQELEEVKAAVKQKQDDAVQGTNETQGGDETARMGSELQDIQQLSELLDSVYTSTQQRQGGPSSDLLQQLDKTYPTKDDTISSQSLRSPPPTSLTDTQISQALAKTADFDARITEMESALGLNGDNLDDTTPILHTIAKLDRQVQLISTASASVDAAQQKTTQLSKDLERLQKLRAAQEANNTETTASTTNGTSAITSEPSLGHADQLSRINALYSALPVIDSLSPVLPLVLERLRTLQALHGSAANASHMLDEIERRQNDQEAELRQWREALDKVEGSMKEGEGVLSTNVKTVEGWVKDLEARISGLSRGLSD